MKKRDLIDLLVLAALWGGSFLFMRVASPEFGPIALIELRVVVAAIFLSGVLALQGNMMLLREHALHIGVVGVINSAIPFCLLAYTTLSLTAGFASILNATTPMWGAVVAWIWLQDRPNSLRLLGFLIGFTGVIVLTWNKLAFNDKSSALAIAAGLTATLSYGIAASYTKRYLTGVNTLVVATGSQVAAAVVLAPLALWAWPKQDVSWMSWICVLIMGIASTGIAYILFFRLIANIGPARAITVTFLVPVFAIFWGAIWLNESLTVSMIVGGAIVLFGTGMSTGVLKFPRSR